MIHGLNYFEDESNNIGIQPGKCKRNVGTEKRAHNFREFRNKLNILNYIKQYK